MQDVAGKDGRTVLFVSHNMGAILSLCPNATWLDGGEVKRSGAARGVVNEYLTQQESDVSRSVNLEQCSRIHGGGDRLRLESLDWLSTLPLQHGEPLIARINFRVNCPVEDVSVGLGFSSLNGTRLLTFETDFQDGHRPTLTKSATYSVQVEVDSLPLAPAIYMLDVGCRSGDTFGLDYLPEVIQLEVVPGPKTPGYIVRQDASVRLSSHWNWS